MAKKTYEIVIEKVYRTRKSIEVDVEEVMKMNPSYFDDWMEDMVVAHVADESGLLDDCSGYDLDETNIRTIFDEDGEAIFED